MAFNNATAADSVRLLEKFARELIRKRAESASGGDPSASAAFEGFMRNLPSLTAMAERAASAAGLDFTPSPEETLEGARRRFESGKVRFVTFEDDDLDENDALEREVRKRYETSVAGAAPVDRVVVPGTHLSPVFIRFDGAEPFAGVRQARGAQGRGRGAGREAREGERRVPARDRLVRRRRGGTKGEG